MEHEQFAAESLVSNCIIGARDFKFKPHASVSGVDNFCPSSNSRVHAKNNMHTGQSRPG